MSRFYLTTAIDYVNSRPHLGTAYEKIAADVIARYKRLEGVETHFVMGNDEHSQNVFKKAQEEGLDPLAYCDAMEQVFRRTWARLDVSFDDFIRTTEPRHRIGVAEIAQRLYDAGDIYEGTYEGWYCVGCEEFKQDKDLVDGRCPLHPTLTPEWIREKNYFFRLSKYQQPLLDHFAAHPGFMQPDVRRNEILRFIEGGLLDVSVSRAGQSWGIPLPWDPSSVVYVWFDALINYASAVGLGSDPELFGGWWPADLHVIGKDITRFHAVIWPAMLMSAQLPLPRQIFGHGFMTMNGQRMSKTLGTIVDPMEAAARFGADPLRLYLVKEITFGSDGDFSWERYEDRYNVDLANNLGNLVSRITAMAEKYRGLALSSTTLGPGRLAGVAAAALEAYRQAMPRLALESGVAAVFTIVDAANEYIASTEPWVLATDPADADRLTQILFDVAEAVRIVGVLLLPVMPRSAAEILRRMGETVQPGALRLDAARWQPVPRALIKGGALWPRFEAPGSVAAQKHKSQRSRQVDDSRQTPGAVDPSSSPALASPSVVPQAPAPASPPAAPGADRISIDDFMKVDLRVVKVLTAERVPNSRKLLKLSVDAGTEQRTLVAGISEAYEPETLVGRTVVIVFNLKPAKLMGIESNGMVLAASADGGKPVLVGFDQDVAPGTRVR